MKKYSFALVAVLLLASFFAGCSPRTPTGKLVLMDHGDWVTHQRVIYVNPALPDSLDHK